MEELSAGLSVDSTALVDDLLSRTKPSPADFLVGVEFEFFGVERPQRPGDPLRPLAYFGPRGIEALFEGLCRLGWAPELEDGKAIALEKGTTHISLEPGGQVELSGSPFADLAGVGDELRSVVSELLEVGDSLGLEFYQCGRQPFFSHVEIPWVPKGRYGIMKPYLGARGEHAHKMMKETSGIQVNLDATGEADLMRKFRVATAVSPLVTAMFANSAIREGQPSGWQSERLEIWRATDPARCGLIPCGLKPGVSAKCYIDYALDVPMMFLWRDGWIAMKGRTFRDFLATGHGEHRATWTDWNLHLSGIFTEVRIKGYLEVRSIDAVPWPLSMAVPALWKGLLYDAKSLDQLDAMTEGWRYAELEALSARIPRDGLGSAWRGGTLQPLAERLVEIARGGLSAAEQAALEPLVTLIAAGENPSVAFLRRWEAERWGEDLDAFLAANGIRRLLG